MDECRDGIWLYRDEVKKAEAKLELNLARNAKNNRKGFYVYINQKRKVKGVPSLMNSAGKLHVRDEEKADVLSNFLQPLLPHFLSG